MPAVKIVKSACRACRGLLRVVNFVDIDAHIRY
jgi:hypothetical protein